ncbi:MAG: hypothetical protein ACNA7W_16720 [Pseudomonadales bacterium]
MTYHANWQTLQRGTQQILCTLLLLFSSTTMAGDMTAEQDDMEAMDAEMKQLYAPFQQLLERHLEEKDLPGGGLVTAFDYRAALAADAASAKLAVERLALDAARKQENASRKQAAATGKAADKRPAKRARGQVQRISARVALARAKHRQVQETLKAAAAAAKLAQRIQDIQDRLLAADTAAEAQMQSRLEKAVQQFRSQKSGMLGRAEARRRKQRQAAAKAAMAALTKRQKAGEKAGKTKTKTKVAAARRSGTSAA